MAKRLTDSEKWKRAWFSDLTPLAKLVWIYLTDECDSNGCWHSNFKRMAADIGEAVTPESLTAWFGSKLVRVDADKFFIPSFVAFQYGDSLTETNNAHKPVLRFLEKYGLNSRAPYQPLASPSMGGPKGGPGEGEGYGYGEGEGSGEARRSDQSSPALVGYAIDTLIARARSRGAV